MTGQRSVANQVRVLGTCPTCGKTAHPSRKDAKAVRRQPGFKGQHFSVYQCESGWWHIGHIPGPVLRGDMSRADLPPTRPRRTA